jgi:hypothetical protein
VCEEIRTAGGGQLRLPSRRRRPAPFTSRV